MTRVVHDCDFVQLPDGKTVVPAEQVLGGWSGDCASGAGRSFYLDYAFNAGGGEPSYYAEQAMLDAHRQALDGLSKARASPPKKRVTWSEEYWQRELLADRIDLEEYEQKIDWLVHNRPDLLKCNQPIAKAKHATVALSLAIKLVAMLLGLALIAYEVEFAVQPQPPLVVLGTVLLSLPMFPFEPRTCENGHHKYRNRRVTYTPEGQFHDDVVPPFRLESERLVCVHCDRWKTKA